MKQLFGRLLLTIIFVISSMALGSSQVVAATLLSVDLGGGATQSNFTSWDLAGAEVTGPVSTSFTTTNNLQITATFSGGNSVGNTATLNTRNRTNAPVNCGFFTQSALMSDRIVSLSNGSGRQGLFLELAGFAPNTSYHIQVWGYDTNQNGENGGKPGNFELFDVTGVNNRSLGYYSVVGSAVPRTNDDYSVGGWLTSDSSGKIVVQSVSNIDGTGIMNGFVITAPEPRMSLLVVGGLGALLMRSRCRNEPV